MEHPDQANRLAEQQRGNYLLEFSVVIIVVLVFLVGFLDISRVLQARAAVRAAVSDGMRCLYATDAGCPRGDIPAGNRIPLYNSIIRNAPGFTIEHINYFSQASWFDEPYFEASYAQQKLDNVSVELANDYFKQHDVLFPVVANAPYLLKHYDLPYFTVEPIDSRLRGEQARAAKREALLNPVIVNRITGATIGGAREFLSKDELLGHTRFSISNVELKAGSSNTTEEFHFQIPDIWNAASSKAMLQQEQAKSASPIPCYQGPMTGSGFIQWPLNRAPDTCSYRSAGDQLFGSDLEVRAPIMLRITGDAVVANGASGRAKIAVAIKTGEGQWRSYRDYGGRGFDQGTPDASLVVRGTQAGTDASNLYFQYCTDLGWSECSGHSEMPMVKEGQTISVKFTIHYEGGARLGWKGRNIDVFYPQFKPVKEVQSCGYSTSPAACANSVAPMRPSYNSPDTSQSLASKERLSTHQCLRDKPAGNYYDSSQAGQAALQGLFAAGQLNTASSFWARSSDPKDTCAPSTVTRMCSGKTEEHLVGCAPVYAMQYIRSQCDLADFDPSRDKILGQGTSSLPSARKDTVGACKDPQFPACGKPYLVPKGVRFFGAGSNNCQEALGKSYYENHGTFVAYNPYPQCPNKEKEFIEDVKSRIPPGITPIVGGISDGYTYTPNRPTDPCIKYASSSSIPGGQPIYCAKKASKQVANKCCRDLKLVSPNAICDVVPSGGVGFDKSGNGGEIDTDGAVARVVETAQFAYPEARSDMPESEPNSLSINVEPDTDEEPRATINAQLNVPMMLLLGRRMVSVQHSESRVPESRIVGGNF